MTQKSKIIQMLVEFPYSRNVDIAKALGVTPAYVSVVRQRNGFPMSRRGTVGAITISPANSNWINGLAALNKVSPAQMVNAILTDARTEEQELRNTSALGALNDQHD